MAITAWRYLADSTIIICMFAFLISGRYRLLQYYAQTRMNMNYQNKHRLIYLLAVFISFSLVAAADEPAWKFIISGDSRGDTNGVNVPILSEIAAEIVSQDVDFVLFPGDLVTGGVDQTELESQLTTWRNTMQPVYDAGIAVYPVRGNHELGSPVGTTAWNNVFSGAYALPANGPTGEENLTYSVTHKNVFVLALDQYVTIHRVNQTWADAQLAANTQPHIFALGHEPAFQVQHTDCLDDYPTERDTFWQSLANAGCRYYTCGHDHFYDHALIDDGDSDPNNNVHQYVVGTAGAPLRTWSPPYNGNNSTYTPEQWHHRAQYGYVLVEVLNDSDINLIWYERDSQTGDYAPVIGPSDLDGNYHVDIADLLVLTQNWLRQDCRITNDFCAGADIDQLTTVDDVDLAYFVLNWLNILPLEIRVNASSDDAEERNSDGNMYLDSSDLELVYDSYVGGDQTIGIRFNNVDLDSSATIVNAYIQFTVNENTDMNPCALMIYAQAADNAPEFTSTAYDISSRTKTSGIAWTPSAWPTVGKAGPAQQTTNIASLITSIITRPGWQKGNSIVIIITGTGRRTAESFDGSLSQAALLHIDIK